MSRWEAIRRLLFAALLMITILSYAQAFAQAEVTLRASPPNVDQFPTISLFLSITDEQGRAIDGLQLEDFTVLEDGKNVRITDVAKVHLGTRQVFVINTSRGLTDRDSLGLTRFDYVRQDLLKWWLAPDAAIFGTDDLSLITAEGPLVTHTGMAAELASSLYSLDPDFSAEPTGSKLLLQGLDFAADPAQHPGIPNHLVFITPLIRSPNDLPLANAITRAKETGTTIYPILVGPEEVLEFPEVSNLQLLADETGGEMTFFDPDEGFSTLAERILSQRTLYQLSYTSQANTSGAHSLQVQVSVGAQEAISNQENFLVEVKPPEVVFIQPIDQITRKSEDPATRLEDLPPTSTELHILITFPDGYDRPITSSQLVIDGKVEQVNRSAPFDRFTWDLSSYIETDTHSLQVVVEDTLGLEVTSLETAVQIQVIPPPTGLSAVQPASGNLLTIIGVLSGGILLVVLIFSVNRRFRAPASPRLEGKSPRSERQKRATLGTGLRQHPAEAFLDPESPQILRISLTGIDLILGSDASLTPTPLEDPSVSGMHARIIRLANGKYKIQDLDSDAGTWINYHQVEPKGQILQHNDLIHLGRVAYRFHYAEPPAPRQIHIQPMAKDNEQPAASEPADENDST